MGREAEYLVWEGVPTNFSTHCSHSFNVKYHDLHLLPGSKRNIVLEGLKS